MQSLVLQGTIMVCLISKPRATIKSQTFVLHLNDVSSLAIEHN